MNVTTSNSESIIEVNGMTIKIDKKNNVYINGNKVENNQVNITKSHYKWWLIAGIVIGISFGLIF